MRAIIKIGVRERRSHAARAGDSTITSLPNGQRGNESRRCLRTAWLRSQTAVAHGEQDAQRKVNQCHNRKDRRNLTEADQHQ